MGKKNEFSATKIDKPKPAYHQVVEHIQNAILEGQLLPDDKLPNERDLSKGFNVGRRTLREAIRVLEQKGLVQTKKSGTFVKRSNLIQFSESLGLLMRFKRIPWRHLVEFRAKVESVFIEQAMAKITSEEIADLEKLISKGYTLMDEEELDWRELINVDLSIHLAIAKISGNQIFEWFLRIIIDNLMSFFERSIADSENFAIESFKDMEKLVSAIKENDFKKADSIMREHIDVLDEKYVNDEFTPELSFESSKNAWGLSKEILDK